MPAHRNHAKRRLWRLIFADVAQCAQVILNSLRHDLLLAEYLGVGGGPDYGANEARKVRPTLDALLAQTEQVCAEASRLAAAPPADEKAFFEAREELGRQIAELLHKGGVVHHQLRAFIDTSAPDMITHWTRLETGDSHGAATVRTLAEACARALAEWSRARGFAGPPESDVVIDFAHDSDVRNDARTQSGRLTHHLTTPYWMMHLFRYITVVAHEVSHPFVDRDELFVAERIEARELVVDLFDDLRIADTFGRPLRLEIVEGFAARVLSETLADAVALHLVGPSYVAALGCYLLGTHEWLNRTGARLSVPTYVRLRTLVERVRASADPGDSQLADLVAAVDEAAEARVLRLEEPGGNEVDRLSARLQRGLQKITASFVGRVLEHGVPDRPVGPAAVILAEIEQLWKSAARASFAMPLDRTTAPYALDAVRVLADLPEGKRLVECAIARQGVSVKLGEVWALLPMYLRAGQGSPAESDDLLASLDRFVRPDGSEAVGIAALVLGPCDALVLRRGARVRRPDQLDHDALGGVRAYVKRRLLLEVERVAPMGAGRATWRADPDALLHACALTELQVEDSEWCAFLLDLTRKVRRLKGVRPVAIFRGMGWANLVIAWSIESSAGLMSLHSHILSTSDTRLHRSITQILTKTLALGASTPARNWDDVKWGKRADLRIVASVRTNGATRIGALPKDLETLRRGETVEARCLPVFGLYDAFVEFVPRSGRAMTEAGDLVWRAVAQGTLRRSNTMLRFANPSTRA
ncbi:MAG: hypothetical protein V4850_03750 [Myxococcota bacterium]